MSKLYSLTLTQMRKQLLQKKISVQEVVQSCLDRIEETESKIHSLLYINRDQALQKAKALDQQGPDPQKPLWGIPCIIKDVITTKGIPTTCASKILENFIPVYDSEAVRKLKEAGVIILGKSNMDEFAMGSSTENSAFGATQNPWDLERVPGGSSGGSAASTASYQAPFSLGTDTGGSIRQPASFCGLVGLKPTYGLVSRFGLIAYGSSLDQIGPMTRTVKDVAAILQVIAGHDVKDSTSAPREVPNYLSSLETPSDLQGIKLGVPKEYWGSGMTTEVENSCRLALEKAEDLGAELVPISLPHSPYAVAAYYIIVMAEASSNLARYDGVRYGYRNKQAEELKEMYMKSRSEGFGNEVQRRIILGTYVLSAGYYDAYYKKAAQVRCLVRDDYLKALTQCDLICAPVAPTTAFKLGEKIEDPLQMYLTDIYTNSLNLTGLPGLCIPVGLGEETNMPVGLQLFGSSFSEDFLLQVGHLLEKSFEPLPNEPFGLKDH